jgi:hypothetical protein
MKASKSKKNRRKHNTQTERIPLSDTTSSNSTELLLHSVEGSPHVVLVVDNVALPSSLQTEREIVSYSSSPISKILPTRASARLKGKHVATSPIHTKFEKSDLLPELLEESRNAKSPAELARAEIKIFNVRHGLKAEGSRSKNAMTQFLAEYLESTWNNLRFCDSAMRGDSTENEVDDDETDDNY